MAYSTCRRVLALVPNLFNNSTSLDNLPLQSTPGSAQIIDIMSSGCALINARLISIGYAAPAASSSQIYDFLSQLESYYVAWQAEMSRESPRTATGERTRAEMFRRAFYDGLGSLCEMDLSRMSVGLEGASDWYIGGRSQADKDAVEGDDDRVTSRFARDQFLNFRR